MASASTWPEDRAGAVTLPDGATTSWVTSQDGTRIRTLAFGPAHAPKVVLAHGFALAARAWAYQVRDLRHTHRVIAYDARGHGESDRPLPSHYTVEALGHDLQAVLAGCLPENERAVVVGHSMGGIGVMAWAKLYPAEVERRVGAAVLISASAQLRMGAALQQVLRWIIGSRVRFPLRAVFGARAAQEHMDALTQMLAATPAPVINELSRALARLELLNALPRLTVPTWVVAGGKDRASPSDQAHRIARHVPTLKEHILLPHCGHMAPWEERTCISDLIASAVSSASLLSHASSRLHQFSETPAP
ncbi:alpha/beta fold hydrolase [Lysobacter fragariae]